MWFIFALTSDLVRDSQDELCRGGRASRSSHRGWLLWTRLNGGNAGRQIPPPPTPPPTYGVAQCDFDLQAGPISDFAITVAPWVASRKSEVG